MWKRLSSSGLNKALWDDCVHRDPAGLVTGLAWYLDAVAPGWEGWVKEENEQYTAVLPLVKRKIAGMPVITQPLLTQQFGLFSSYPASHSGKHWQELLPLLLRPREAVEKYCVHPGDYTFLKNQLPLTEKTNWILPLTEPYYLIKARYRANRKQDLRKATLAQLNLQTGDYLWPQVAALYRQNVLIRLNKKQQNSLLNLIPKLIGAACQRGLGRVYLVSLPSGQVVAGAFFMQYKNRLTYLLPAASAVGKKVGASTYLLDQVIQELAGSSRILDFEGSSIPGLAYFYQSFGAQREVYGLLENYNLPVFLKFLRFLKQIASRN